MGKSVRSKWCRKMRAIKRVRYAEKELVKLRATVPWYNDGKAKESVEADLGERSMQTDENAANGDQATETEVPMSDQPQTATIKKRRKGPILDEHGHYPVWYKQRTIKKLQKQKRKSKRVKKRAQKRKQVPMSSESAGNFF